MLEEDKIAVQAEMQAEMQAREEQMQREFALELEQRLKMQHKETDSLGCQTPIEFLKELQQSLDDEDLDKIIQDES